MERGAAEPLPDWVAVLFAAEELNCHGWDLVNVDIPKRVWMWWALTLTEARGIAQELAQADHQATSGHKTPI